MKALKKKLLFVMLLALILSLLAGCGGNGETSAQEPDETVVEEPSDVALELVILPTPAVFFDEKPGLSIPQWDEFIFENDPGAAVLAYVDLLQSAYGLTLIEQSEVGTEMQWDLQYQENENAAISISVGPFEEKTKVDIMYSSGIRWQDGAVYEWPESSAAEIAYAPDPEFFFNTGAAEKGDGSMWTFLLSETPEAMVLDYVALLENTYGMTVVDFFPTENPEWYQLQRGDDESTTVTIGFGKLGDGEWELNFTFGDSVTLQQAETWTGGDGIPDPEPTPIPEPEPEVNDPSVLPDFLAHDASGKYELDDDSTPNKAIYKADTLSAEYVAEDYVELLKEQGYTVVFDEEIVYSRTDSGKTVKWDLYHSGVSADAVGSDSNGQVRVKLNVYTNWNECSIAVEFSNGITMENFSGGSGGGGSSGSGGSSSSGGSNNTRTPCSICNRTGDCQTCGGDGYLWSSAADKENRNCYSCRNHNGKCTNCNGKGWLD